MMTLRIATDDGKGACLQRDAEIAPKRKRALPVGLQKRAPDSQPEREIFARNFRKARIEAGLANAPCSANRHRAGASSEVENAMHNIGIDTMVKLAQAVKKPVFELLRP